MFGIETLCPLGTEHNGIDKAGWCIGRQMQGYLLYNPFCLFVYPLVGALLQSHDGSLGDVFCEITMCQSLFKSVFYRVIANSCKEVGRVHIGRLLLGVCVLLLALGNEKGSVKRIYTCQLAFGIAQGLKNFCQCFSIGSVV